MQRARKNNPKTAVGQRKNNFFQRPRNTSQFSRESKLEPKSTRAAEETGNEFFIKPMTVTPKPQEGTDTLNVTKRPFDKKTWRIQKYSKKYKLDQWEDRRKKTVLREYYRQIDPNEKKLDVDKIYQQYDEEITTEENDNDNNANADTNLYPSTLDVASSSANYEDKPASGSVKIMGKRKTAFQKARDELARMKEEKRLKKEVFLRRKEEKEEKLKLYQQKKAEKYKKLNKKTKKGQPIMKDRMEMLLEQIQNNM